MIAVATIGPAPTGPGIAPVAGSDAAAAPGFGALLAAATPGLAAIPSAVGALPGGVPLRRRPDEYVGVSLSAGPPLPPPTSAVVTMAVPMPAEAPTIVALESETPARAISAIVPPPVALADGPVTAPRASPKATAAASDRRSEAPEVDFEAQMPPEISLAMPMASPPTPIVHDAPVAVPAAGQVARAAADDHRNPIDHGYAAVIAVPDQPFAPVMSVLSSTQALPPVPAVLPTPDHARPAPMLPLLGLGDAMPSGMGVVAQAAPARPRGPAEAASFPLLSSTVQVMPARPALVTAVAAAPAPARSPRPAEAAPAAPTPVSTQATLSPPPGLRITAAAAPPALAASPAPPPGAAEVPMPAPPPPAVAATQVALTTAVAALPANGLAAGPAEVSSPPPLPPTVFGAALAPPLSPARPATPRSTIVDATPTPFERDDPAAPPVTAPAFASARPAIPGHAAPAEAAILSPSAGPAPPPIDIALSSPRLGDVRIGVEGAADDLRVSIGLSPAAAAIVAADTPRLIADLAATGIRLQTLDLSNAGPSAQSFQSQGFAGSGGGTGQPPPHPQQGQGFQPSAARSVPTPLAEPAHPRAADRYA